MLTVIEDAQSGDHASIRAFMLESLTYHQSLDQNYYKSADDSKKGLFTFLEKVFCHDSCYKTFVAKNHSGVLGFVVLGIIESSDFDYDTKIQRYGSIVDLYVGPNCRGMGLGEKLMRKAEEYFLSKGIDQIGLQMSSYNSHAYDLYERLGYVTRQWLLFKDLNQNLNTSSSYLPAEEEHRDHNKKAS